LIAGSALAAKALSPDCAVYGVEPEAGNDVQQSLRAGKIVRIDTPQTLADGAQTQAPGDLTFAIIREKVTDVLTVSDQALVDGMKFFARQMKLVVEPTGCLAFAGARQIADQLRGKRVGVIISGGNVDLSRYTALLNTAV
jgi:threonine dehydratase